MTQGSVHEWDGAYVLGALSPAERAEFESHLETCTQCRAAVGELAPLPGLLARVDPAGLADEPGEAPPAGLEERLLAAAAARPAPAPVIWWRRTPVRVAAGVGALLVAAALAVFVLVPRSSEPSGTVDVALRSARLPLTADVSLRPAAWGTSVHMVCRYRDGRYGETRPYMLYVVDGTGRAELVSSWRAGPGDTSRTDGSTEWSVRQIRSVELRAADGTVLLRGRPS